MKHIFTYLGRIISFTLMLLVCSFSNAATYYISSSEGDDTRTSTQAQNQNTPWKSLDKINSIFSSLQPGDNILFKSGDTFQGTLTITKSGTAGAPITIGSYGSGEKPIITSMVTVSSWTSLGGNIYQASVNVSDALNIVLLNGEAQAMGRFPNASASNKGFLTISSVGSGSVTSSELSAPTSFTGGEIVLRKNNWIIDRHTITYHSGTSVGYNTSGSYYSPYVGFGFFIQNHPGTLDQNGEWYYNSSNKTIQLYYDKGNPSSANVQVALNNQVVTVNSGISNITFSNVSIQGSNENLINLNSSANITFTESELKFAGKNGVQGVATSNFVLQNSLIEDTYNSALFFQWSDSGMKILNNTFDRNFVFPGMGRNGDLNGNTIYMSETSSNGLIQNNKVYNSGYQGINFNGNNTVVKNNLVDTFCFVKDDGAGIYTYTGSANTTLSNREVVNNIVINGIGAVQGTKPYGPTDFPYVEGIYMDDNSTGVKISGNTIANIASSGIYIHNSRSLEISDNNIFNVGNSIRFVHDNLGDPVRNVTMKGNNFLSKTTSQNHIFVRSKLNDVNLMGTFDQNVYSKPINENNTIEIQTPSVNGLLGFLLWKSTYGLDANSTSTPVVYDANKMEIDEFILFEYNYSSSAKSLPLSGTYVDMDGTTVKGSVSIPAYSSVLLLKTEAGSENAAPTVSLTSPTSNAEFFLGDNVSISATASDSDGSIAKVEFYNGTTLLGTDTSSPYSFSWTPTSLGSFSVTAKATDNLGSVTESEPTQINVVELANVAPTVSITSPSANAQIVQGESVTISATASDSDGSIAKVDFYNGTTLLGTDTSSPYSITTADLSAGTLNLTAQATDDKGAVTVSSAVQISVTTAQENVAPNVNITSPSADDLFTQGDDITITASASDSDGTIAKVDFYNGTTLLGTDTSSPYSYVWTVNNFGDFTITAKATDDQGTETTSSSVSFTVEQKNSRTPHGGKAAVIPGTVEAENFDIGGEGITYHDSDEGNQGGVYRTEDVDLGAASEGAYTVGWMDLTEWLEYTVDITSAGTYDFEARLASPAEGGTFHIEIDGVDVTGTLTVPASGGWNSWASVEKTGVELPEGTHIMRFVLDGFGASGYFGNLNYFTFTAQNEAPSVSITSPSANSEFTFGDEIAITANASDSDGSIAKVEFYNGTSLLGTDTSAPYSLTTSSLPVGTLSLTAQATDDQGTVTVSSAVNVTVAEKVNVAPTVSITSPSANAQFTVGDNITITANAADSDGTVAKVEFYNGTTLLGSDSSSPYSISSANLPVGTLTLTAQATDNEGTVTVSSAVKVTVAEKENVAPTVSITSPTANAEFTLGENITITANATDSDGTIAKVEFYNGTTLLGSDSSSPYSISSANLPVGTLTLTAQATDDDGTVTVSSAVKITVIETVNDGAPTVSITSPSANSKFAVREKVTIKATATDSDGSIAYVQFYNGTTLIGTDKRFPYTMTTNSLPEGIATLIAKATDNDGLVSESIPFEIIIGDVLVNEIVSNPITENGTTVEETIIPNTLPYGGAATVIPGTVEAENYDMGGEGVSYHDTDGVNSGGAYRTDGVDISQVGGGGYTIGWLNLGEWMDYTVNVSAAGTYNFEALISAPAEGGTFHIELDGVDITGTLKVPATGGWNNYTAVAKTGITLPAGIHVMRFVLDGFGPNYYFGNLNSFTFTKASDAYRIFISSASEGSSNEISTTVESIEAEAGEKVILFVEEEENMVFDHWQLDGVKISNETLFELDMPGKDVFLTKHFRSFEAPEMIITLPNGNSEFEAFSTIHIGLETVNNDALIEKVELFNGNMLVGELTGDATGLDWNNIPVGSHQLVAKATDSNGKSYFSEAISLEAVDYRENDPRDILLEYAIGPNPTQDNLTIFFKNLDGVYDFEFRVVSMTGVVQKTFAARPEDSEVTINVSDLKNGVYVLHLTSNGNNVSSTRFIKN